MAMKFMVSGIGGAAVVALLLTVGLYVAGYPTAAAVVASLCFFTWSAFLFAAGVAIGEWHSLRGVKTGSALVLEAQHANDSWDARKMQSMAALSTVGLKAVMQAMRGEMTTPPALGSGAEYETFEPVIEVARERR
jgi:hypothetical protein